MSGVVTCGICCMLTSAWAIIQLLLMGVFYYGEAVVLLEDCDSHEYDDYDDYINKTKGNYQAVAINCWIATGIYVLTFVISYICVAKARKREKAEALKLDNDDYACTPKEPSLKEKREMQKKEKKEKKELEKRLSKNY